MINEQIRAHKWLLLAILLVVFFTLPYTFGDVYPHKKLADVKDDYLSVCNVTIVGGFNITEISLDNVTFNIVDKHSEIHYWIQDDSGKFDAIFPETMENGSQINILVANLTYKNLVGSFNKLTVAKVYK